MIRGPSWLHFCGYKAVSPVSFLYHDPINLKELIYQTSQYLDALYYKKWKHDNWQTHLLTHVVPLILRSSSAPVRRLIRCLDLHLCITMCIELSWFSFAVKSLMFKTDHLTFSYSPIRCPFRWCRRRWCSHVAWSLFCRSYTVLFSVHKSRP